MLTVTAENYHRRVNCTSGSSVIVDSMTDGNQSSGGFPQAQHSPPARRSFCLTCKEKNTASLHIPIPCHSSTHTFSLLSISYPFRFSFSALKNCRLKPPSPRTASHETNTPKRPRVPKWEGQNHSVDAPSG